MSEKTTLPFSQKKWAKEYLPEESNSDIHRNKLLSSRVYHISFFPALSLVKRM